MFSRFGAKSLYDIRPIQKSGFRSLSFFLIGFNFAALTKITTLRDTMPDDYKLYQKIAHNEMAESAMVNMQKNLRHRFDRQLDLIFD